jgi:hypothetical protein
MKGGQRLASAEVTYLNECYFLLLLGAIRKAPCFEVGGVCPPGCHVEMHISLNLGPILGLTLTLYTLTLDLTLTLTLHVQ